MTAAKVVGGVFILCGIVLGNISLDTMTNATATDTKDEMFSTGTELDTPDIWTRRAEGVKQYQASTPDGPLLKWRRAGWVLIAAGLFVWVIGAFH